jgi:hypothetical protein
LFNAVTFRPLDFAPRQRTGVMPCSGLVAKRLSIPAAALNSHIQPTMASGYKTSGNPGRTLGGCTLAFIFRLNEPVAMLEESINNTDNTEIENISAATDLLRRMLLELQGLAVNNARLHLAMSNAGHAIRQRLDMLSGITELLKLAEAPLRARALSHRAKALIRQLAGELEQVSFDAEHDFEWIA